MNIENFQPVAGDHAVEAAYFVLEWAEPLRSDATLALAKLATKFRNLGLPAMAPQQTVSFQIGPDAGNSVNTAGVSGFLFSPAPAPNFGTQVLVSSQNCMITIPEYTRWDSVFAIVSEHLKVVLEEVGPLRPVKVIGLQYTDAFNWNDDPDNLELSEIFKPDFVIPPNVLKQKGLWHLHHGYLERSQTPLPHSLLENINVDMVEKAAGRRLQIIASHRATLDSPLWQPHMKNKPFLNEMFLLLHEKNKRMLRSLLTDAVCGRIQLNA